VVLFAGSVLQHRPSGMSGAFRARVAGAVSWRAQTVGTRTWCVLRRHPGGAGGLRGVAEMAVPPLCRVASGLSGPRSRCR